MKSLCLRAIGVMIFGFSSTLHSQTMNERLQAQKDKLVGQKKGRVCAPDLTEEQVVEFLGGAESDEVILSPFHKANIGNIVFTNTEMAPKDITAADIVTEFSIIVANLTIIIRVTFLKIITEKTDLTIKALIESIDRDIIVGSGNNQRLD